MLTSLKIQNIALIPQVEIEFGSNLNVLTGETGAGKSIILGSLNFILGDKLNKSMIRSGETRAHVTAVFSASECVAAKISDTCGIETEDGVVILSRIMKSDGKTECRINSNLVTTTTLKEIAQSLIHIHGQHDTETVLRVKNHLNILDSFGGEAVGKLLRTYRKEYEIWKSLESTLKSLGGDEQERARQVDLYTFQINEIEQAELQDGEDEELQEKKTRFQNFAKIAEGLSNAVSYMSGDDGGALSQMKSAIGSLGSVSSFDMKLEKMYDDATNLQYALADIECDLSGYLSDMEMDEEEFALVDARLDEIKTLKRKYGATIQDILAYLEKTRADLNKLLSNEQELEKTKQEIGKSLEKLKEFGKTLSDKRKAIAKDMEKKIVAQLAELEMKGTSFEIRFKDILRDTNNTISSAMSGDTLQENMSFKPHGIDDIEFLFSANAGEPLRPLANIISGGEMSRFMLAMKTLIADKEKIGTMIFDEIDTGIGGTMGTKIGKKMAELGKHSQVICVTHLAQVASKANTHFLIQKCEKDSRTTTTVYPLDDKARLAEIARMIGGGGDSAIEHAKSMLGGK